MRSRSPHPYLKLVSLLAALAVGLLAASPARARSQDAGAASGSVELDQPAYTAHENQGELTITIVRTGDVSQAEHVGYGVKQQDGWDKVDFDAVPNTYATIPAGASTYSFQVHIIDQGMNATPVHALAYLYGAWPQPLGANSNSIITILRDDPLQARDPANPLGAPIFSGVPATTDPAPLNGNPLAGVRLYVDPQSPAAKAARRFASRRPAWSKMLWRIASEPSAHRFFMWNHLNDNVAGEVARWLENTQLQEPGTTVMLSSYNLIHGHCGHTATPAMEALYDHYMDQLAQGIGNYHVIFFLELDALITAPCLNHAQLAIRDAELQYAIAKLEALPHVVVYLDAGAADAAGVKRMARLLAGAGVAQTQGFFLNSTHFDWTTRELHYGQELSRMLGGAHFVINTGENGRGPLRPRNIVKQGNEVLCNPPGRGLGPLSVAGDTARQTGYAGADGFLWFSNPGGSGGQCVPGAPPTAVFWPKYAVGLAKRWVNRVSGPRYPLARAPLG